MKNEDVMKHLKIGTNAEVFDTFNIYMLPSGQASVGSKKFPSLLDALKEKLTKDEYMQLGLGRVSDQSEREESKQSTIFKNRLLPTTTALEFQEYEIECTLDVVGAEVVYGHNFFKEMATGVRDLVGGRSVSIQKTLAESRRQALLELKEEAGRLGADAVIAVDFTYTSLGSNTVSVLVAAIGTAVKLKKQGVGNHPNR